VPAYYPRDSGDRPDSLHKLIDKREGEKEAAARAALRGREG